MKKYNIAIVGASGNVGREILNILDFRSFPIKEIYALASSKSEGQKIIYGNDKEAIVKDLEKFDFKNVDIVFSSAGSEVSKKFIPKAVKSGAIVIDNTSYFRMNKDVPLIVPEVNSEDLKDFKKTYPDLKEWFNNLKRKNSSLMSEKNKSKFKEIKDFL